MNIKPYISLFVNADKGTQQRTSFQIMFCRNHIATICFFLSFLFSPLSLHAQKADSAPIQLEKALEYFTSAKYHEALLIFQRLDKQYKLNNRFKAYIGLCYYHEWDYKYSAQYLDAAIPKLGSLAPHERSVYYFAAGESHFHLEQYKQAIPHYENALAICYDQEKAEINYRLGFCYMFAEDWEKARDYFIQADTYYQKYKNADNTGARLAQVQRMRTGCQTKIDAKLRADSLLLAKAREDSLRLIANKIPLDSIILEESQLPVSIGIDSLSVSKQANSTVIAPQNTDSTNAKKPVITPLSVQDSNSKTGIPIENNPQKTTRKQKSVAPINLENIYKEKIEVSEYIDGLNTPLKKNKEEN